MGKGSSKYTAEERRQRKLDKMKKKELMLKGIDTTKISNA
jgi:hypothetical protein